MGHGVGVLQGVIHVARGRGAAGLRVGGRGLEQVGEIVGIWSGEVKGEINVGEGGGEGVGIKGGGGGSVARLELGVILRRAGRVCVVAVGITIADGRKRCFLCCAFLWHLTSGGVGIITLIVGGFAAFALVSTTFATFLQHDAGNAFECGADAEHALYTALLFGDGEEREEIHNLIHEFHVGAGPRVIWILENVGEESYKSRDREV